MAQLVCCGMGARFVALSKRKAHCVKLLLKLQYIKSSIKLYCKVSKIFRQDCWKQASAEWKLNLWIPKMSSQFHKIFISFLLFFSFLYWQVQLHQFVKKKGRPTCIPPQVVGRLSLLPAWLCLSPSHRQILMQTSRAHFQKAMLCLHALAPVQLYGLAEESPLWWNVETLDV